MLGLQSTLPSCIWFISFRFFFFLSLFFLSFQYSWWEQGLVYTQQMVSHWTIPSPWLCVCSSHTQTYLAIGRVTFWKPQNLMEPQILYPQPLHGNFGSLSRGFGLWDLPSRLNMSAETRGREVVQGTYGTFCLVSAASGKRPQYIWSLQNRLFNRDRETANGWEWGGSRGVTGDTGLLVLNNYYIWFILCVGG